MGQTTLEVWGGGGVILPTAGPLTLRWWWDRSVQTIRASAGGQTMTVQLADEYPMPWGQIMTVINPKDATQTFTLRDTPGTWSFTCQIGRLVWLHRVRSTTGTATWWPILKVIR